MKKILSVLLVLSIVLGTFCSCQTVQKENTKISVSGTGAVTLTPDTASFNIQVSETEETTKQAQNAVNEKISKILETLEKNGVDKEKLTTLSLNINTVYHWDENNKQIRDGERVTQSVKVFLNDITIFPTVIDEIGKISGLSISNVTFDVSDKQKAMEEARKLAYADARDKAQTYCDMSGLKLSRPLSVSEYSSTSSPRYSNAKMAYAAAESMDMVAYGTEIPSGNYSVYVNADCLFEAK